MQVAHQNDHITHAVIGGGETIDFGISSSAEFFNILSSTLYKDQILAVVREVLCNANDAHIEAGMQHKPVEITLTEDRFTIRDFGTGIHRDDIGPIYGVYGNSTKKNDGKQTGGFGLGCKAPFAYTDHFEVISFHEGVKTIYNMSKSSAQALGKPGIVPIASFPTKESGLQVSIHIHSLTDQRRFFQLIERIASNGDMNMTLNGKPLDQLGFDTTKANYLITSKTMLEDLKARILVRYGNVIYPVDSCPELRNDYNWISKHLERLDSNYTKYSIVFQAPPHSISVTPSRESLSMQEHTIKTLDSLFTGFLAMLDAGFKPACEQVTIEAIQSAVNEADKMLLTRTKAVPGLLPADPEMFNELPSMARRVLKKIYPEDPDFLKFDIHNRLTMMAKAGQLDRGLVQTYVKELDRTTNPRLSDWFVRHISAPLVVKLQQAGIDCKQLYAFDWMGRYSDNPLRMIDRYKPRTLFDVLPFLRNIIVIGTSRQEINIKARMRDAFMNTGGHDGYLFYHLSMKTKERKAAIDFFKSSGMLVIDLTEKLPSEIQEKAVASKHVSTRKPAKVGYPMLKTVKRINGSINLKALDQDSALRIAAPEFVLQVSLRAGESRDRIRYFDEEAFSSIITLFGDKGAITNSTATHDRCIKNGAVKFMQYLQSKVCAYMASSKTVQQHWAIDLDRACTEANVYNGGSDSMIQLAWRQPLFQQQYGLVDYLTEEDKHYIRIWKQLVEVFKYGTAPDEVAKVKHQLKAIPIDPAVVKLVKLFDNNPLENILHDGHYTRLLKNPSTPSKHKDAAIQMLIIALNNK